MKRRACAMVGACWALCCALLAAGCADINIRSATLGAQPSWQGRLAVSVASEPPQGFSAGFLLQGSAGQGRLALTSVLGTSLATLEWDADGAILTTPQQSQRFTSADDMVAYSVGTPLPIATLFGWLQGEAEPVAGWQVDLQSRAQGRIKAWRLGPDAATEIKIILDPG